VLAENLDIPNGTAFINDSLYVAEISRVIHCNNIETRLEDQLELTAFFEWIESAIGISFTVS
jgi:hypothetical protein